MSDRGRAERDFAGEGERPASTFQRLVTKDLSPDDIDGVAESLYTEGSNGHQYTGAGNGLARVVRWDELDEGVKESERRWARGWLRETALVREVASLRRDVTELQEQVATTPTQPK